MNDQNGSFSKEELRKIIQNIDLLFQNGPNLFQWYKDIDSNYFWFSNSVKSHIFNIFIVEELWKPIQSQPITKKHKENGKWVTINIRYFTDKANYDFENIRN